VHILRREILRNEPDAILSFGEYWNSFVLLALLGFKRSVFVSDRCRPDKYLGLFHQFFRGFLYCKASVIIFQTSKAREFFQNLEKRVPLYPKHFFLTKLVDDKFDFHKENTLLNEIEIKEGIILNKEIISFQKMRDSYPYNYLKKSNYMVITKLLNI
jgi:hypothetical protein